ncbi:hypothetical protein D3C78_1881150 [compost metagenome]
MVEQLLNVTTEPLRYPSFQRALVDGVCQQWLPLPRVLQVLGELRPFDPVGQHAR